MEKCDNQDEDLTSDLNQLLSIPDYNPDNFELETNRILISTLPPLDEPSKFEQNLNTKFNEQIKMIDSFASIASALTNIDNFIRANDVMDGVSIELSEIQANLESTQKFLSIMNKSINNPEVFINQIIQNTYS